jgi:hypothetical protein
LAALSLGGAAAAAFIAWFFISDMIADWSEAYGPQTPDQPMPSWWGAHRSFGTVFGFVLWFTPSFVLLLLSCRLVFRAFSQFRSTHEPHSTNVS